MFALAGRLASLGYLDFLSDSSKNPSLSSNISGSAMPVLESPLRASFRTRLQSIPQISAKPVEISDVTSDGDTLLSLLSISMSDEREAEIVASNLPRR